MKVKILIVNAVIVIALALSCCHPMPVVKPLFKDAAIQDSLQCFLERIDSVPNHFNAPSLYAVSFNLRNRDSLIRFGAYVGLWMYCDEPDTTGLERKDWPLPDIREPNWIGLYQYGKKYVLVESDWDASDIIDLSVLEPWEEFESQYHDTTPWDDDSFYHENCEKVYQYRSPDSLRLIRRRIGRPDPDFKDWPRTIE